MNWVAKTDACVSSRQLQLLCQIVSGIRGVQAEAKERKEGSLKEVALLSMELDELRSNDFETKYEDAKDQV